ncbi:hypothetical protein KDL45_19240, partial [bacterium]|nr:hypothetical protein [bacterium]
LFKETILFVVRLMMIFVPIPQKAVHDVLVGKPGYKFHAEDGGERDSDVSQYVHIETLDVRL